RVLFRSTPGSTSFKAATNKAPYSVIIMCTLPASRLPSSTSNTSMGTISSLGVLLAAKVGAALASAAQQAMAVSSFFFMEYSLRYWMDNNRLVQYNMLMLLCLVWLFDVLHLLAHLLN